MGRKKKLFDIVFEDSEFVVVCRSCKSKDEIRFVAGPKVSLSCSCGAETILKLSSWSKYLRAIKAPEVSRIEKPLGDGTAVKTLGRDPPNLDEASEFVTVDGMTVPRSGYGGHGSLIALEVAQAERMPISPSGIVPEKT